jgi:hypothetical protein
MEPEGSQQPTNYPFTDPYQYLPSILSYVLKIQLIIVLSSTRSFEIRCLFLRFPHQNFQVIYPLCVDRFTSIDKFSQTQRLIFVLLRGVSS